MNADKLLTKPLVVGNYLSPFVRKVLVCLELKQIDYQLDPIVPFFGNDDFTRISPLRRIPVYIDGSVTLSDSTVICEYLDEAHPQAPLLPHSPADRARARWLEEYADTRIADVLIWQLFNQVVISRFVWGKETDTEIVSRAMDAEIPAILGFLEREVPNERYLFGELGRADIAIAAPFRNAAFAGYQIDAGSWPVASSYLNRVLEHPAFQKLRPFEELSMRTPILQQRAALQDVGAPVSATSLGTDKPRRGVR